MDTWVSIIHHLVHTYNQTCVQRNTIISCLRVENRLGHLDYTVLFCLTFTVMLEWINFVHAIYFPLYFWT